MLKPVLSRNFPSHVKNRPKFALFGENVVKMLKKLFSELPKGTSLRETASFDVLIVKICAAVASWKNPPPK